MLRNGWSSDLLDKTFFEGVVGVRDDNWIDIGECKWGETGSPESLVAQLTAKVEAFPNPRNSTLGRMLFTRDPIRKTRIPANMTCYSLENLYSF